MRWSQTIFAVLVAFSLVLCSGGNAWASSNEQLKWIEGGRKVDLGNVAEVDLDPSLLFLDAANTAKVSEMNHDKPSGKEIGSIFPKDENQNWEVVFEYYELGHIKDDEKEDIDADAILDSYKEGTEESNKEKAESDRLYVTGWDVEPFYNEATHNLTWSMLAEDGNKEKLINYNVRLLTRQGYISAILVSDPAHLDADKKFLSEKILPRLTVKSGERYEEFDASTDKISEYGLTGLILGGAGLAVAKKAGLLLLLAGLFKKFGILIFAAGAGVLGVIGKFFAKLFRRKKSEAAQDETNDREHTETLP
ncbi:DUF2167 domain-containing protein [Paenibacillus brasilensis]|uniref:Membrane-anchored protein n=1 Tax=Paenibacillus brasilensis TaxID=128574 RepID=A0ABU0KZE0_9BACL|nr:DUF2167 domain-containing protein [Paenibacillus brasilensis]MDQ0494811.1 putative membrane-anchored protein [Paenibacillus brasilensis]